MANSRLKAEIERILSQSRKEIPVEEVYRAVKNLCETDKPREEFNRTVGEVVNLGTVEHRNTLEYKGVIELATDSNDEEEDMAGPSDCYGRNARGRRGNARGGRGRRSRARSRSASRSQSRKRKRSSSRGPKSPKKMT
ncbi:uncharacterized protein ACN2A1_011910 [Glossina fuscipes fuscipes]